MKLQKLIEKYKPFNKYKRAGCSKCDNGKIHFWGNSPTSISGHRRCDCSSIFSKKYSKFLDKMDKYKKKLHQEDYEILLSLWKDNNSHCDYEDNSVDRSW